MNTESLDKYFRPQYSRRTLHSVQRRRKRCFGIFWVRFFLWMARKGLIDPGLHQWFIKKKKKTFLGFKTVLFLKNLFAKRSRVKCTVHFLVPLLKHHHTNIYLFSCNEGLCLIHAQQKVYDSFFWCFTLGQMQMAGLIFSFPSIQRGRLDFEIQRTTRSTLNCWYHA